MKCKNLASAIAAGAILAGTWPAVPGFASSHMDAPLITLDDPANTTDVYAFLSEDGIEYLTTAGQVPHTSLYVPSTSFG